MTIRHWSTVVALALAFVGTSAADEPAQLDPRLGAFLEFVIHDAKTLESEKREYASHGVTFETFIYAVYTRAVTFDGTPDNSAALAQLGQFLEQQRPELSPLIAEHLAAFYETKANQTMMRGMVLQTVRGLTRGARAAKSSGQKTLRFGGLQNEALGAARLGRGGAFLTVTGIGASGADGVRILLPKGTTQARVQAQFPDDESLAEGDYVEIASRPSDSADSLGFLRITRSSSGNLFDVTGAVAGAASHVIVALRRGSEVLREPLSPGDGPFARVNTLLRFESSLNDAAGRMPSREAVLRWVWASPSQATILRRANGPDTTVNADELRLLGAGGANGPATLAEILIRGRNLGTMRIRSEEALKGSPSSSRAER